MFLEETVDNFLWAYHRAKQAFRKWDALTDEDNPDQSDVDQLELDMEQYEQFEYEFYEELLEAGYFDESEQRGFSEW